MNRIMLINALFLAMLFASPAWSHHPAEDIVSDEIWQMVDDMLVEADSPHMDLVFDDMGQPTLATSVVVDTDEAGELMEDISTGVDDIVSGENSRETSNMPADGGSRENNQPSAVSIVYEDLGNGTTEITILEPISTGQIPPQGME